MRLGKADRMVSSMAVGVYVVIAWRMNVLAVSIKNP